jgi:hypothetical protein
LSYVLDVLDGGLAIYNSYILVSYLKKLDGIPQLRGVVRETLPLHRPTHVADVADKIAL